MLQNIPSQFDCIFVQGLTKGDIFSYSLYRKRKILSAVSIYRLQMVKESQMKLVILLLENNELYSVWKQPVCTSEHFLVSRTSRTWEDACSDACIRKTRN